MGQAFEAGVFTVVSGIAGMAGAAVWWSAPNSCDAMAYHLARVVSWALAGRVDFFPTQYFTQISHPPFAEHFMLHTFGLTGGGHPVKVVAWPAFAGCSVAAAIVGPHGAVLGLWRMRSGRYDIRAALRPSIARRCLWGGDQWTNFPIS